MKIIIKSIITAICRLWSRLYTYNVNLWMKEKRDMLYTLWIKNFIGELGEGSTILYPCSLQGGGAKLITIGKNSCIHHHTILGCWSRYKAKSGELYFEPKLIIGSNCNIGEYSQVTAINKLTIGDGLLTGRYVYIGDNAHGGLSLEEAVIPPAERDLKSKGPITIGNNVWIGDKVTILPGGTIGDNVIIGANSVVTHDIPSNSMAAGAPAKVVKMIK